MFKRLLILSTCFVIVASCGQNKKTNASTNTDSKLPIPTAEKPEALKDHLDPEIEDIERTEWQNPDLILNLIGDLKGKTVADIGAGSGYFTFKLARTAEKVIALDIDPNALEYIENQKEIVGDWSQNIDARLTPPDVPNLLDEEVDIVLIVNTYNFIPNKPDYFPRLSEGMKTKGQLFIVDFKKGNIPVGPSDDSKVDPQEIRSQLRRAGFRKIEIDHSSLQFQYIITATKK